MSESSAQDCFSSAQWGSKFPGHSRRKMISSISKGNGELLLVICWHLLDDLYIYIYISLYIYIYIYIYVYIYTKYILSF